MNITSENFESEIMSAQGKTLLDFWAPWCGPCLALSPVIAELEEELKGKVKICKINVDEQPELTVRFDVTLIPTLVLINNGQVITQTSGILTKAAILEMLEK